MSPAAFRVEKVALHLVDRSLPGPVFSDHEIQLGAIKNPEDRATIQSFFDGHLSNAWDAEEGVATRAAMFEPSSPVQPIYAELAGNTSSFFQRSCDLAQLLYEASQRPKKASPGLLMVLWVYDSSDQPFLAMFKMEPGRADRVTLREGKAGEFLLDLAVQHIEHALPDPRDRVLKWAIVRHPHRKDYDVKLKDEEAKSDPARYFVTFLGCRNLPQERRIVTAFMQALEDYGNELQPGTMWRPKVLAILDTLRADERPITTEAVAAGIEELNALPGFERSRLRERLPADVRESVQIRPEVWDRMQIEYLLPGGIVIRGPRDVMESQVTIVEVRDGVEFHIKASKFDKKFIS